MLLLFATFVMGMMLHGHPMSWSETWPHLLAGGIGLALGMGMFAVGWVGGGDAKLFAMACLWLGWDAMYQYTLTASVLGGFLTLALLMFRRVPLPPVLAAQPWLLKLADREAGVPYGIALAIAALNVLPDTEVFRLAATS
jgi:prepilin peptidase CpaA